MTVATGVNKKKKNGRGPADNDTRDRILGCAEELFIKRGFDGVSVKDVADASGVAKALVFYYFNNKQELFDTVLDSYYQAQTGALVGAVGASGTVREKIHSGIDAYLDFVEKHPGYPRLIQREICAGTRNIDVILKYMAPLYNWGLNAFGSLLPQEGPLSARHFFISFFGMAINYYTYEPVLTSLWGVDSLSGQLLEERRKHLHLSIDALLDAFMQAAEKEQSKTLE